ncbi:MAG: ketopantoate reductase family protein [Planifilum fulgidum]
MRVLIVGAGGVGGYFGGRLVEKGADVTFLVRQRRKEQLREKGLVIHSVHGDFSSPVQAITAGEKAAPFDLIILSVKAYHLEEAIRDIRPYVADSTAILPLLNGMSHLDRLESAFGRGKILGGLCQIETTLNDRGEVEQYSSFHNIVFGELDGSISDRVKRIEKLFSGARMTAQASREIRVEMWHKYVFIAAFSGMTSMMRSSIGPIMEAPWGRETYRRLAEEIAAVARFHEPSLTPEIGEKAFAIAAALEAPMKSSMLRDVERGGPTETDHLHGWLIQTAPEDLDLPLLKAVYASIKAYEAGREQKG